MPFQKGNKLGAHGNHRRGFACWNKDQLKSLKWIKKGTETQRVRPEDVDKYITDGWVLGRHPASSELRKKLSESHRGKDHPSAFKKGHRTWNHGEKMPAYAGQNMSAARLAQYGITLEQVIEARSQNKSWCSHHRQFEPNEMFHVLKTGRRASRCNQCHNKHTSWYKEKFKEQRGCCPICGDPEPRADALSLDHHHDCPDPKHTRKKEPRVGCICSRGLLCSLCNPRLGYFEPMIEKLTVVPQFAEGSWEYKAHDYLKQYPLSEGVSQ